MYLYTIFNFSQMNWGCFENRDSIEEENDQKRCFRVEEQSEVGEKNWEKKFN